MTETLERFIFSTEANVIPNLDVDGGKTQPEMLNRFLGGLVHPFIHAAYGAEFGVPGQLAEGPSLLAIVSIYVSSNCIGLAQAAIHPAHQTELVPYSLWSSSGSGDSLLGKLASALSISGAPSSTPTPRPTFAFHRTILEDTSLAAATAAINAMDLGFYEKAVAAVGDAITKHVTQWYDTWLAGANTDAELEKRLEGMVEEVIVGNTLWYGVGGWDFRGENPINADFFTYVSTLYIAVCVH